MYIPTLRYILDTFTTIQYHTNSQLSFHVSPKRGQLDRNVIKKISSKAFQELFFPNTIMALFEAKMLVRTIGLVRTYVVIIRTIGLVPTYVVIIRTEQNSSLKCKMI